LADFNRKHSKLGLRLESTRLWLRRTADNKPNSKDRQKLPLLVMKAELSHKSGNDFRTTAKGNLYTDHQIIAHIIGHAKDSQGKPRDDKHKKVARLMTIVQDFLEDEMRSEREAGRPIFETNDDECAAAVMEKFWVSWGKRCPSAPPENRMEASRREWNHDWADMIFWYGQSPEEMLVSLLEMQARAVKLRIVCTNDEVKSKFNSLALA
jgi:hypothetical protein